jgi:hypothetical protein
MPETPGFADRPHDRGAIFSKGQKPRTFSDGDETESDGTGSVSTGEAREWSAPVTESDEK